MQSSASVIDHVADAAAYLSAKEEHTMEWPLDHWRQSQVQSGKEDRVRSESDHGKPCFKQPRAPGRSLRSWCPVCGTENVLRYAGFLSETSAGMTPGLTLC